MKFSSTLATLAAAASLAPVADAHLCLLYPHQRGDMNITGPGSNDCFNNGGSSGSPCGDADPSAEPLELAGGAGFHVVFQQNLNHYQPGNPGYLAVEFAETEDGEFTELATVNDFWAHMQANQRDFSVPVVIPNVDAPNGVLRAVYHPNKPTEPTFFRQCADVSVTAGTPPPAGVGGFFAQTSAGLQSIGPDGSLTDTAGPDSLNDGMLAVSADGATLYSATADQVDAFDYASGAWSTAVDALEQPEGGTFVGLAAGPGALTLIGLTSPDDGDSWQYEAWSVDDAGSAKQAAVTANDTDGYVNYMWSAYDAADNDLYLLAGYEDDLWNLPARLHTIDLDDGSASWVELDVDEYTFNHVHVDPDSGKLFALSSGLVSPGAFEGMTLVTVDPESGDVAAVGDMAVSSTQVQRFMGGGVYGQAIFDGNFMHVVHSGIDAAPALARVDLASGELMETQFFQTGVDQAVRVGAVASAQPSS